MRDEFIRFQNYKNRVALRFRVQCVSTLSIHGARLPTTLTGTKNGVNAVKVRLVSTALKLKKIMLCVYKAHTIGVCRWPPFLVFVNLIKCIWKTNLDSRVKVLV